MRVKGVVSAMSVIEIYHLRILPAELLSPSSKRLQGSYRHFSSWKEHLLNYFYLFIF